MGVLHLLLLSLILCTTSIQFSRGNGCIVSERNALLAFKKTLTDPSNRLSSWSGQDCCKWAAVRCNNRTGHVTKLKMRNPERHLDYYNSIGGEITASLLELKHLTYLDLSNNNFYAASIPRFFSSMSRLRYLNLSHANFGGIIPHQLGNLTKLHYLDLSSNYLMGVDSLGWLSHLSSLQYLDLSNINLTEANVFDVINKLPVLSVVHLSDCLLSDIPATLPYINFSSLFTLDLSKNNILSVPNWVFGIQNIMAIDLSYNSLSGPVISEFGNFSFLQMLRLQGNNFSGTIPKSIGNLCSLRVLDISYNLMNGDISKFEESLSGCARDSLQALDLQYNNLSGKLPDWLGTFKNLSELHLENNHLSGFIPKSFQRMSALRYLYLANNKLEGPVPEFVGQLANLVVLDLSFNSFRGFISNVHFSNLTKLEALFLSSNYLVMNMSSDWVPPFQLKNIHLGSCVLGPRFPPWIQTQMIFSTIDLSNGNISGVLPDWFWGLSSRISYLNLSHNQISGNIPVTFNILTIDLRSNQFHGPLPQIGNNVKYLYLSNNLFSGDLHPVLNNSENLVSILLSGNLVNGSIPLSICDTRAMILDLSSNHLSGEIPYCSSDSLVSLSVLNLANNNLSGEIPQWMGSLFELESLHLSNNSFHGKIPSLEHCVQLYILDLGENSLEGNIPSWIGKKFQSLKMLRLRSNQLIGNIPQEISLLTSLQVLDLANNNLTGGVPPWLSRLNSMTTSGQRIINFFDLQQGIPPVDYANFDLSLLYTDSLFVPEKGKEVEYSSTLSLVVSLDLSGNGFSGEIPEELMKLVGLQSLVLSRNQLTGKIPDKIGDLHQLESLDLSCNQLSGAIPQSISNIDFLSLLNFSHNNLSGRIPTGNQLSVISNASYAANNHLCGFPLTKSCPGDKISQNSTSVSEKRDGSETIWIYTGGMLGLVAGFWSVWGVLLFNKSWRIYYFKLIDKMTV